MRIFKRKPIAFSYRGRRVEGQEGDTVGSALYAAGVRIFSRSFQYNRPRGLFCVHGRCVSCTMRINGSPHVRACSVRLEPGMIVEPEGGWPSVSFDIWRMVDFLHFLLPPGFQYRYFIRPRWMFRIWENIIRHVASHASMPSPVGGRAETTCVRETTDVVVVGGGPAGVAAARAAAGNGLSVTLIDDDTALGGSLKFGRGVPAGDRALDELRGEIRDLLAFETLKLHVETRCFAYYGSGPVCAVRGNTLIEVTAKAVVIATGAYERPMIFDNNDLPGIFLSSGALRLLRLYGVRPGKRVVVATRTESGIEAAVSLLDAGLELVAVIDERPTGVWDSPAMRSLRDRRVRILGGYRVDRAHGLGKLRAITAAANAGVAGSTKGRHKFSCDVLVTCGGFQPAKELLFQATSRGEFLLEGAGGWTGLLGESPLVTENGALLLAAGNSASIGDLDKTLLEGRIAGLTAVVGIDGGDEASLDELHRERENLSALLTLKQSQGDGA